MKSPEMLSFRGFSYLFAVYCSKKCRDDFSNFPITPNFTPVRFLPHLFEVVIVALYPCCRVLHHLLRSVRVLVQRESGCSVAQQTLNAFYIRAGGDGDGRRGMPLRYNNDKPEKSRIFKGFQGFKPDF